MTNDTTTPTTTVEPLLLDTREAAALCGIGRSLWQSLDAQGRTPQKIKLGRRVLWRADELKAWIAIGCPNRERWERMRSNILSPTSKRA